jgi:hypothetical protein
LGGQPSEMYRIHEELGLGKYYPIRNTYVNGDRGLLAICEYLESRIEADGDILILNRKDIQELGQWLDLLREDCNTRKEHSDYHKYECYVSMIDAIYNFATSHLDREEFIFEGEF